MKHLLLTTIGALVLVGCGESQQSTPPAKPESALKKSMKSALEQGISNARAKRAVLKAVKKGDIEAVKQAITDGTDVNADGFLVAAIKEGHKEIAELLIAEGANVNGRETSLEGSPLHQAVSQDMQEIIDLLITKGAYINVKSAFYNLTPLDWAVKLKKTETIKLLQKHGGKSAAEDSIHFAVQLGNFEAVKKHLDAGADINSTAEGLHETPLDFTEEIKGGNSLKALGWPEGLADTVEIKAAKKEIADFLRSRGGKHSSIFEAAKGGDLEGVKEFLAAGVDPDEMTGFTVGQTPLHVASTKEVAELLIKKGADVNSKGKYGLKTALDYTISRKRSDIADLLRKHGGKTRDWLEAGDSIYSATRAGHIEAVKQHLAKGTDVNEKKGNGETSLHDAADYGHKEIAELLIKEGADVNPRILIGRQQGMTPLDLAIRRKRTETADLLRKHGGKTKKELKAVIKSNELESDVPELGLKKDKSKFYYDMAAIKGNGANWPVTKKSRVLRKNYSDLNDAQFIDKLFSMMEKSEGKIHAFVLAHKDRTQKEINYATAKALNHPYEKSTSSTGQQVYTTSEYLFEAESFSKLIPKKFNLPSSAKHEAKTAEELKAEAK